MSKSSKRQLPKVIAFRVDKAQLEALASLGQRCEPGLTPAQAARAAALRDAGLPMPRARRAPPPDGVELRLCLVSIGKIADKISRLAEQANSVGDTPASSALDAMASDVAMMRRMLASTLRVGANL
jgi:hypothetical protein